MTAYLDEQGDEYSVYLDDDGEEIPVSSGMDVRAAIAARQANPPANRFGDPRPPAPDAGLSMGHVAGAVGRSVVGLVGGLLPNFEAGTMAGMARQISDTATKAGLRYAEHPNAAGTAQAITGAIPLIGEPLAQLASPSVTYASGEAPTREDNIEAIEGGVAMAGLVAAPKVASKILGKGTAATDATKFTEVEVPLFRKPEARAAQLEELQAKYPDAEITRRGDNFIVRKPVEVPPVEIAPQAPDAAPLDIPAKPDVQPSGAVRFYHGGPPNGTGEVWLTPSLRDAQGWARKTGGDAIVQYVDIPEGSSLLPMKSFDDAGASVKSPYVQFAAPPEIARALRPVDPLAQPLAQENLGGVPFTMEQAKKVALEVPGMMRSVSTSIDLSAPFRQGAFLVGNKRFWQSLPGMLKAFGTEGSFAATQAEIAARPTFGLMQRTGLALTDLAENLSTREEAFKSVFADKIPGVRASGRAYTAFLNKLRADVFDDMLVRAGEIDPRVEQSSVPNSIARFVNAATGRGNLPGVLNEAQNALNAMFFSPRLISSRLTLLNPMTYISEPKVVRQEALKSALTFGAFGLTVASLSAAAGAEVGDDPRSTDFGKIKVGNTRFDPWGGFQQYVVLASRLAKGETANTSGRVTELGKGYAAPTRATLVGRTIENKLSPAASLAWTLLKGKDFRGQPLDIKMEIAQKFIPMVGQDIYEVAKDNPALIPIAAPASVLGFGVQTFGQPQKPKNTAEADPFGHDEAVQQALTAAFESADGNPQIARQIIASQDIYYEDPDGKRVEIPYSVKAAFANSITKRADNQNMARGNEEGGQGQGWRTAGVSAQTVDYSSPMWGVTGADIGHP